MSARFITILTFTALIVFSRSQSHAAIPTNHDLFGVQFYIGVADPKLNKEINSFVESKKENWASSFDPDCYYKKDSNKKCGKPSPEEIDKLAEKIAMETKENFRLIADKEAKKPQRDYGGIAQGAVLEELARKYPKAWWGNFAGDIYVAPETKLPAPLAIMEPISPDAVYAEVEMESGWISPSLSREWGGKTRSTGAKTYDFDKIVLFAKPEFNGARIDAWATALVEGGKDLLKHLESIEEFKGQWTYMYFENGGNVVCSAAIDCDFKDEKNRKIKINWKKGKS